MSYQLQDNETLGESLRRVCGKQIEAAIAVASGAREADDTPVHETRKHLKKARAALRLARKEIGRGLFKRQDHCLRDVARLISEIRDAEVRLQTVRELQGIAQKRKTPAYRSVERMLTLELENFLVAFADWQSQAVPMLESARTALEQWNVADFGCKQLRREVQRTYKCARKALACAKESPTPENFHHFRTQAKLLWSQLRILRPVNQVVLKSLSDDLRALGDLLGRAHDLSFLGDRIAVERDEPQWRREGEKLLAVIEISQGDLQRGAADLAERFFAERPRDFGGRVAAWLEDWPNAKSASVAEALVH
jgi:CHAD domain-containing protein